VVPESQSSGTWTSGEGEGEGEGEDEDEDEDEVLTGLSGEVQRRVALVVWQIGVRPVKGKAGLEDEGASVPGHVANRCLRTNGKGHVGKRDSSSGSAWPWLFFLANGATMGHPLIQKICLIDGRQVPASA
jgi:hypothetical protein